MGRKPEWTLPRKSLRGEEEPNSDVLRLRTAFDAIKEKYNLRYDLTSWSPANSRTISMSDLELRALLREPDHPFARNDRDLILRLLGGEPKRKRARPLPPGVADAARSELLRDTARMLGQLEHGDSEVFSAAIDAVLRVGFTKKQISEAVEISAGTIARWIRGTTAPSATVQKAVLERLRVLVEAKISSGERQANLSAAGK